MRATTNTILKIRDLISNSFDSFWQVLRKNYESPTEGLQP